MSLRSIIDLLRKAPFFEGFAEDQLRLVAFSAETLVLPPGEVLCEEAGPLKAAYLVASGNMEGRRGSGEALLARPLKPGTLVGEMALLVPARAHETVVATGEAQVVEIRRQTIARLLDEYPEFAQIIRTRIARRMLAASAEFKRISDRLGRVEA